MRKPLFLKIRRFTARLTKLNYYKGSFLGSYSSNNMVESELNEILFYIMLNGCSKQAYLRDLVFKFPARRQSTCLNVWKPKSQFTQGQYKTSLKPTEWADANYAGLSRENIVKDASYNDNPYKQGYAGKSKTRNADKSNGNLTEKNCMIHGAGHSSEECKVLSDFGRKWSSVRPSKYHKHRNSNTN